MQKLNKIEKEILEKLLRSFGAEEQELDINSNKPLVIHKEHAQLSLVISGNGYVQLNNKICKIEEGSLVLFDKNTPHSFLCIVGKMKLLHIHFPKIFANEDWYMLEEVSKKWSKFI